MGGAGAVSATPVLPPQEGAWELDAPLQEREWSSGDDDTVAAAVAATRVRAPKRARSKRAKAPAVRSKETEDEDEAARQRQLRLREERLCRRRQRGEFGRPSSPLRSAHEGEERPSLDGLAGVAAGQPHLPVDADARASPALHLGVAPQRASSQGGAGRVAGNDDSSGTEPAAKRSKSKLPKTKKKTKKRPKHLVVRV